jgi:hypothetical protein
MKFAILALLLVIGAAAGLLTAKASEPEIPLILGCRVYLVLGDKGVGDVRWLARATKDKCQYIDLTHQFGERFESKPDK